MVNWEFDGSVDFAPPHYRKTKYEEIKQLNKQIINEATALEYLEAFQYIEYLAEHHNIDNYQQMQNWKQTALNMLKSKEAIFKWITYPSQHTKWQQEFNNLRKLEKDVVNEQLDIDVFAQKMQSFNNKWSEINKECKKYGFRGHTLYWIKNGWLKSKMQV